MPDLLRSPGVQRLDLRGFGLAEVRVVLASVSAAESAADPRAVLEVTAGNSLFVREVAAASANGTWLPDRPPRTVLDVVPGAARPCLARLPQAGAGGGHPRT
ncbi:MAG TPA: hypothetical protein VM324_05660 [Egibacteraceae bacterium]|jgi:hypothetical protein|nr:hypothetical protein [Egibacteraceae bacterium]